jgi:hypothetical protein
MPFSIPTYYASQFVKNSTLQQRKAVIQQSYKTQYALTGLFLLFNMEKIINTKGKKRILL